ncbi:hypothetical protein NHX12_000994 [Muraenolepis orangiensis]|uniref:G-protein coupled receptors family 1 profile domain-containing protein n=1 Tax=Muraenolepis orangiensis TaxID=630683 RepID=A0A9Q0DZM2_9TELE|nr:hypothetical protein NHX12_000994 [Muraenolepis orangiensis]
MMSLLGNGTVLLVYLKKRRKLHPHELIIVNLAVCDFGFCLLGAPFAIASSLCHAWVFGEAGCFLYGMQGFVFGIASLLTTCLISLDRCLKICCLRYGQWRMRWYLSDRIYIVLIMTMCFGLPAIGIITCYTAILLTVYRSQRTLASIPFAVVHGPPSSKDLKITKVAAVVCASFLMAWTPYAVVSLYSALVLGDDDQLGSWGHLLAGSGAGSFVTSKLWGVPSLFNWTRSEGHAPYNSSIENWGNVSNLGVSSTPGLNPPILGSAPGQQGVLESMIPMLSLIPVLMAKSHCMLNPLMYQIMNPEFRQDARDVLFCRGHQISRRTFVCWGTL